MPLYHFSGLISRLTYYIVIVSAILIPLKITISLFPKEGITKKKITIVSLVYILILSVTLAIDKTILVRIAFAILLDSWIIESFSVS